MKISKLYRKDHLRRLLTKILYSQLADPNPRHPVFSFGSRLSCPVIRPYSSHRPCCCRSLCSVSSTGLSSHCSSTYPSSQSSACLSFCIGIHGRRRQSPNLYIVTAHNHGWFRRSYSTGNVGDYHIKKIGLVDGLRRRQIQSQVSDIINLVRRNGDDLETNLALLNVKLSLASATMVFRVLNCEKVSALRFFRWIIQWQLELGRNTDVCSLAIDNCGRLKDYNAMRCLLDDFKANRICLSAKAFGFLSAMSKDMMMLYTERVIDVLREIGGSSYGSGIYSLVEMFSVLGFFDMAELVIKRTDKKLSYYTVLIREMCGKRDFKGAISMPDVMRKTGCDPTAQTYNFLISSLLKNGESDDAIQVLEEMLDKRCPPDALTFEIFIHYYCRLGDVSSAFQFLDDMVARNLKPRLLTHAAFIKRFFNSQQYEKAYEYVVASSDVCSINANYSLLASLHRKSGNPVMAQNILSEMIKKGLRPNFKLYKKVVKHLSRTGRVEFATDLEEQFLKLDTTE